MIFIRKKKVINAIGQELAYLQVAADYFYYVKHDQDMSSWMIDHVDTICEIAHVLGILDKVYDAAYHIYDFHHSGMKDYIPDTDYIKDVYDELRERTHHGLLLDSRVSHVSSYRAKTRL